MATLKCWDENGEIDPATNAAYPRTPTNLLNNTVYPARVRQAVERRCNRVSKCVTPEYGVHLASMARVPEDIAKGVIEHAHNVDWTGAPLAAGVAVPTAAQLQQWQNNATADAEAIWKVFWERACRIAERVPRLFQG